ncbi:Sulfate/thiosulfate import ATP-binding protein CysA [Thalassovita gelatinovora]|uniref:Sulfate/thiosulfate import ATP-binding protein CysA n=1 Tax=Thalassovita gelatinovora TaxID=53501 RepID=A0A0P1F8S0_THAGE|nr:molybdenum ABC transporter ATP-binding protein [Thalassovita gelatinovora]QIZ80382.1 molybdenum ABC transporter ATP-binding protein [Thalassovita gelatinovora]CUH64349.1 Sulfate/thiosulfate import ATP-binding protein CysA [Thalassovita gelatinovora]SEQ92919.1 molybdate transport system ATP-binding protein [Thalassovita gelatinovora]
MNLSVSIQHRFAGFTLDASFETPNGVTALFGSSGSGKTTLVNAIAGLLRPDQARVQIGDRLLCDSDQGLCLPPHKRRIGYVFQEGRLFPHLTVRQNLRYGSWVSGRQRDQAGETRVVDMLGIGDLLDRRPGALSGGEKQRVAIGRALLSQPLLLLMDEPLAALDEARKAEILPYLERLRDETDIPILYVSHSVAEVARLATTVVLLGKGKMLKCGPTAQVMSDPALAPAIGLREAGSVLTATVTAHHADGLTELAAAGGQVFLPRIGVPAGGTVRLRIHANDVMLSLGRPGRISALNVLPGKVTSIRSGGGPGAMVQLKAGHDQILARVTKRSATLLGLEPGSEVFAIIKSVSVAQADIGARNQSMAKSDTTT